MKFRNIINWFLILLFFISFSFLVYNVTQIRADKNIALSSVSEPINKPIIQEYAVALRNWNVADLEIKAVSAIVLSTDLVNDNHNKNLFSKAVKEKLPIASLTKLMTAIIAIDNFDLSEQILISGPDLPEATSKDIQSGDVQSLDNLLHIMLVSSSNRAASALGKKVGEKEFVWLMNQKAKYIGLENTHFTDPTGLLEDNYSTAEDLAKLAIYILKNYPKIVQISEIKEIELPGLGKLENTNKLLGKIPGIIIGKTGFTIDAKECLLLALYNPKAKNYLINVVLGSDDRFSEMQNIINWVDYAYSWQK